MIDSLLNLKEEFHYLLECLAANWFIMIAMYREYRHLNIESCIHVIGILVVVSFEGYRSLWFIASRCPEDLIIEYF